MPFHSQKFIKKIIPCYHKCRLALQKLKEICNCLMFFLHKNWVLIRRKAKLTYRKIRNHIILSCHKDIVQTKRDLRLMRYGIKNKAKKIAAFLIKTVSFIYQQINRLFKSLCRDINILARRHLILSFIAFFISYKFIFFAGKQLNEIYLYGATCALVLTFFLMGRKSVMYSCYICIGLLACMGYYGYKNANLFPNIDGLIWNNIYNDYFAVSITCFILLILFPLSSWLLEKISEKPARMTKDDLYPERKKTYDAILDYLSNHSVIGIDSPYGNGKSTFVEVLQNEKKEWTFITFGVLSASIESIEFCIIREINRILEKNGIFVNPVSKIKSVFSHDFAYCVGELLFEDQTYENLIIEFVKGIQRLKKTIVLNFEDIDRIMDKNLINKIFSITDALRKNEEKYKKQYIKIIFQCNTDTINKLFEKEDGEKRYAEKFIPHSIVLGALAGQFFESILKKNSQKYPKIQNISFSFLHHPKPQSIVRKADIPFNLVNYTVRGIELILDKVNSTFETNAEININQKTDIEAVLIFFITMYFMPHIYEALEKDSLMEDQKLFYPKGKENDDDRITLTNFRAIIATATPNSTNAISEFLDKNMNKKAKENYEALLFLSLLGYDDNYYSLVHRTSNIHVLSTKRRSEIINNLLYYHSY